MSCPPYDPKNPGAMSLEDELFITTNCLPPYLQFVIFIIGFIVTILLFLVVLGLLVYNLKAHKWKITQSSWIACCTVLGIGIRAITYGTYLFDYPGFLRYITVSLATDLYKTALVIIVYQWLKIVLALEQIKILAPQINGAISKLKFRLKVYCIISFAGSTLLWALAGIFRQLQNSELTNDFTCAAFFWFGSVTALGFGAIVLNIVLKLRSLVSHTFHENNSTIQLAVSKMTFYSGSIFFLCVNIALSSTGILIWYLATKGTIGMKYFFYVLVFAFLLSEIMAFLLIIRILFLQILRKTANSYHSKSTSIKGQAQMEEQSTGQVLA